MHQIEQEIVGQCFELSPPQTLGGQWTEKILHSFAGGTDGALPNGGLVVDSKGLVFGTTLNGGNESEYCSAGLLATGCGIVFELAPPTSKSIAWTETPLYVFKDGSDGASPNGNLLLDTKGGLYGTAGGGTEQSGVVFRLSDVNGKWGETVLYTFTGGDDGSDSGAGVAFSGSGYVYGTALGGKTNLGLVFRLKPQKSTISWPFPFSTTSPGLQMQIILQRRRCSSAHRTVCMVRPSGAAPANRAKGAAALYS